MQGEAKHVVNQVDLLGLSKWESLRLVTWFRLYNDEWLSYDEFL